MKRYKQFIAETTTSSYAYPTWVKATAILMASKVRANAAAVSQAQDVERKLDLIADQNKQLAYMLSIALGVDKGRLKK